MDLTSDTVNLLYAAAVVLMVAFVALALSSAIDKFVANIGGRRNVD